MSDHMNRSLACVLISILFYIPVLQAADITETISSVSEILKAADQFRKPEGGARVKLEVLLFKQDALDSRKHYTVYMKPGRRSLAVFNSPGEQGQKALQLDDRFYLLLPKSRRPVRISPMQKLLGEAAIGDISTMTWSEDYSGSVIDEATMVDDTTAIRLKLAAKRAGVTYEQIELWVAKDDYRPLKANLYLKSGRIAKQVSYQASLLNGKKMITAMVMADRIQNQKRTEVHYRSIESVNVPERYFNPAYLTRNHVE